MTPDPIIEYLVSRMESDDMGRSSVALIVWAARGGVGEPEYHPLDQADLGRCIRAWAKAPRELGSLMLPKLREWIDVMGSGSWPR